MPSKKPKRFRVLIELSSFETLVSAKNATEARQKAILKLSKKLPNEMIHRNWPGNKKDISIDEI